MRGSKESVDGMKILKRLTAVAAVLGLAVAMMSVLNYCLTDDAKSSSRLVMHEFYTQEDIDILFVGASRYGNGIDAVSLSERTGKRVFTASSSGQRAEVSLALIKEALDRYTPEHIYLDASYGVASAEKMRQLNIQDYMRGIYVVSDYMEWTKNKWELLLYASSYELPVNFFLPHFILSDRSPKAVLDNMRRKNSEAYKNYAYTFTADENGYYAGKGYFAYTTNEVAFFIDDETFIPYTPDNVGERWKDGMRRIIAVCAEHNVPLTLLNLPISGYGLLAQPGYDAYIDFLHTLTAGTDVDVVDLNTLDTAVWPDRADFMLDYEHLSASGAKNLVPLLADHINGTLSDEMFLPSAAARTAALAPDFYGVSYGYDKEAGTLTLRAVAKEPETQDIRLICRTAEGETVFSGEVRPDEDIIIPYDLHIDITATWKPVGAPDSAAKTGTERLDIEV